MSGPTDMSRQPELTMSCHGLKYLMFGWPGHVKSVADMTAVAIVPSGH